MSDGRGVGSVRACGLIRCRGVLVRCLRVLSDGRGVGPGRARGLTRCGGALVCCLRVLFLCRGVVSGCLRGFTDGGGIDLVGKGVFTDGGCAFKQGPRVLSDGRGVGPGCAPGLTRCGIALVCCLRVLFLCREVVSGCL